MMATCGYSAPECLHAFIRARELAAEVGNLAEHMDVLHGLYNIHYGRAELDAAMTIARQHALLAKRHFRGSDGAIVLVAQTHFVRGEFTEARELFGRTLRAYAEFPEERESLGVFGSQEVVAWAMIAGAHFALGEPHLARAATARSIERARDLRHHMSIALALITRLLTPIPGGLDPEPQRADEAIGFCRDHDLRNFEVWARFAKGAIAARLGEPRQGIAIMQEAVDEAETMHSRLFRPTQLATIGVAHAKLGELDQALCFLADAIALAERTMQRQALAGIHRAHGEALAAAGRPGEGERELIRAIEIAKVQQQAKAEVERIECGLARLREAHRKGRRTGPLATLRTLLRL
jgi:tetratricopeptide (TPR) repeat protein